MTNAELFTPAEVGYLQSKPFARFASISSNGWPHLVPIGYTFDGSFFYLSTEPSSKKVKNVKQDPKTALVIDDPEKPRKAISLQGEVTIIENGAEFQEILKKIVSRHGEKWGFKEGEQVILKFEPLKKFSWGV